MGWRVLHYTQTFFCQCCPFDFTDLSSFPPNNPRISEGKSYSVLVLCLAKNEKVLRFNRYSCPLIPV